MKTRPKRRRHIVRNVILTVVLLIAATGLVLYIQASRFPADYAPAALSPAQRKQLVYNLSRQLMEFSDGAQFGEPYTLTLSQREMNEYLASLDEIASELPGSTVDKGEVNQMMADAGFAGPAVSFGHNAITLMLRSTKRNKVFSIALGFSFTSDRKLQVALETAGVGRLSMPNDVANEVLSKLKYEVRLWLENSDDSVSPASGSETLGPGEIGAVMAVIVAAIGEGAIDTETAIGPKRIRIADITIEPGGNLTLYVQPLGRNTSRAVGRHNQAVRTEVPEELRNR